MPRDGSRAKSRSRHPSRHPSPRTPLSARSSARKTHRTDPRSSRAHTTLTIAASSPASPSNTISRTPRAPRDVPLEATRRAFVESHLPPSAHSPLQTPRQSVRTSSSTPHHHRSARFRSHSPLRSSFLVAASLVPVLKFPPRTRAIFLEFRSRALFGTATAASSRTTLSCFRSSSRVRAFGTRRRRARGRSVVRLRVVL